MLFAGGFERADFESQTELGSAKQNFAQRVRRSRDVDNRRKRQIAVEHALTDVDQLSVFFGHDFGEPRGHARPVGPGDVKDDAVANSIRGCFVLAHVRSSPYSGGSLPRARAASIAGVSMLGSETREWRG